MTSSLVGSEMCIRDSLCALINIKDVKHPKVYHFDSSRPHTTRVSSSPVSYTHLTLPTICSV
eukprot:2528208-Prorocentrum_lima.AAC.1